MKVEELAALVAVRNHIFTVINDKSVTGRDDFRPLEAKRRELDLKFVQIIKDTDVEDLFTNEVTVIKVGGNPSAQDLDFWRQIFEQAKNDSDFKIITHDAVEIEKIDASDVQVVSKEDDQLVLSFSNPIDDSSLEKEIQEKVAEVAQGKVEELEEKLEEDGVTLEKSAIAPDAKLALEEKKKAEAAKKASLDPDIAAAIQRQKEALNKEGRKTAKKVIKANGTTG